MGWFDGNRELLLVLFVALVLRLSLVAPLHEDGYTSDEKEYISLAAKVAEGKPFIDSNGDWSTKAPLWPFLLSVVFRVAGSGLLVPHLLNCLAGVAVVFLGFVLCTRTLADRNVALASAAVLALYPGLVIYSTVLQTETLYIAFVLASFLFVERLRENPSVGNGVLLGVFGGLATLTRAVFFVFFPVMMVMTAVWVGRAKRRAVVPVLGAALVVWALMLTPWTIRNFELHGTFVPVSSWGGISLLLGNNPYATGTWSTKPGFDDWLATKMEVRNIYFAELSEVDRSSVARAIAFEFMWDHPVETLQLLVKKSYMYWIYPISNSDSNVKLQALCVAGDILLYLLAGLGVVRLQDKKGRLGLWWATILFFAVVHVAMHVEARYRLPSVPFLGMFAGSGLALLMDTQRVKSFFHISGHRVVVGMWTAVVALVYAFTAWQFLTGKL